MTRAHQFRSQLGTDACDASVARISFATQSDIEHHVSSRSGIRRSSSRLVTVFAPDRWVTLRTGKRAVGGFLTGLLTLKLEGYEK
jgi:hypothetical protein